MVTYEKTYTQVDRAGKKKYLKRWLTLRRRGQPVQIRKLKKPVGKHKYGVYIRRIK